MSSVTSTWLALTIAVALNAAANILIKAGAMGAQQGPWTRQAWGLATDPWILGGIASFAMALAFYAYALTDLDLSVAYPIMTSLGIVAVYLWSITFFDESTEVAKVAGTLLVLAGVVLLAKGG